MTEETIYERAIRVWKKQPQMLQVIEEMSELTKEILKNVARGKDNINKLIEETADVEIMLEQLKYCYCIHQQVESYKQTKLLTIKDRLDQYEQINN